MSNKRWVRKLLKFFNICDALIMFLILILTVRNRSNLRQSIKKEVWKVMRI